MMPLTPVLAVLSMGNLLVILLIAILVFGASRIPEIARALGQALKEFKKATRELDEEDVTSGRSNAPAPKDNSEEKPAPSPRDK